MGYETKLEHNLDIARTLSDLRTMERLVGRKGNTLKEMEEELLRGDHFLKAQDALGVFVAGFLYIDGASHDVHYRFFDQSRQSEHAEEHRNYLFQYRCVVPEMARAASAGDGKDATVVSLNEAERSTFIDSLFYLTRRHQSPWPDSAAKAGKDIFGFSEYLYDLPYWKQSEGEQDSESVLERDFGWHYCPYGRVTFFLYMWRLLLWRKHMLVNAKDPNSFRKATFEQLFTEHTPQPPFWGTKMWSSAKKKGFESTLSTWFSSDKIPGLRASGLEALKKGLIVVDNYQSGKYPWASDLANLLLIDLGAHQGIHGATRGRALEPLLRFIASEQRIQIHLTDNAHKPLNDLDSLIAECADAFLYKITPPAGNGIAPQDLIDLQLNTLHSEAGFPLMPYYYWGALDKKPKTHAVVPIWNSLRSSFEVPVRRESEAKTRSTVGVAVISIAPMGNLDPTFAGAATDPKGGAYQGDYDISRASMISEILLRSSTLQVDSYYFGQLSKRIDENATKQSMISSFSHDAAKPVRLIQHVLSSEGMSDQDRISVASALSLAMERHLHLLGPLLRSGSDEEALSAEMKNFKSRKSLSSIIDREVVQCVLQVIFDPWRKDRRNQFFGTRDCAEAWDKFKGQLNLKNDELITRLKTQEWPTRFFEKQTSRITVRYPQTDLFFPCRNDEEDYDFGSSNVHPRIYSGMSFIIAEIFRNTFNHQFLSETLEKVKDEGVSIGTSVSLSETHRTYSIRFAFSPLSIHHVTGTEGPITINSDNATFSGLKSIADIMRGFGAESKYMRKFRWGKEPSDITKETRELPCWGDHQFDVNPHRDWEICGLSTTAIGSSPEAT